VRITWYSNAPWAPTGYGAQSLEVLPRLKAAGHDVMVAANYALHGAKMSDAGVMHPSLAGIPVWPAGHEPHSTALSPAHHEMWNGDWLITLYDVWPLNRKTFPEDRTVSWVPIDHMPVTPEVLAWCKTVRLISMSRFGERSLREQGLQSAYIPHSVNTKVFFPRGQGLRKHLGIPESAFVVIINAANKGVNPTRKSWPDMFRTLAYFQREQPDTYVYVHTDSNAALGVNLDRLAQATGIKNVVWADSYAIASGDITQDDLANYYSMGDVLLAPSMGEGFGIPVVEAQACGLPVIVSDFSAQPELCGAGWTVRGQPWWDEAQASDLFTPYIGDMAARLKDAYAAKGDNELRERAVAFAAQYDSDLVFDRFWRPYLAELEALLKMDEPAPIAPRNRAERRAAKKRRAA
jgi:glycosyltransferase involved in cell wall biosynthesis